MSLVALGGRYIPERYKGIYVLTLKRRKKFQCELIEKTNKGV